MSRGLLYLPNLISLLRIPLAVAFLLTTAPAIRVAIIALAAASDYLDGWLARRRGRTRLGAILDPLTDKTFLVSALISLAVNGPLRAAELLVLLSRDIAVAIGFAIVVARRAPMTLSARFPGKLVTVLQLLALVLLTVFPATRTAVVLLVGAASAVAIADYGTGAVRALRTRAAGH